jgi:hypothetical protein
MDALLYIVPRLSNREARSVFIDLAMLAGSPHAESYTTSEGAASGS